MAAERRVQLDLRDNVVPFLLACRSWPGRRQRSLVQVQVLLAGLVGAPLGGPEGLPRVGPRALLQQHHLWQAYALASAWGSDRELRGLGLARQPQEFQHITSCESDTMGVLACQRQGRLVDGFLLGLEGSSNGQLGWLKERGKDT